VVWRIAGGIAIGIASNASPIYIAEVSPAPWRGRMVSLNQLTIVIGILGAQIVNWMIARPVPMGATAEIVRQSWNGRFGWRWMFTAVAIPSMAFLTGALLIPESPRWLVKKGRKDRALRTLTSIGGAEYAEAEVQEIQKTLAAARANTATTWSMLSERRVLSVLAIGVVLAVLQQWSGINVIFNYAEEIYRSAGYGISDTMFNIVLTGAINCVFTLAAIGFVDKFGRRVFMLLGCAGIGLSHILIGLAFQFGLKGLPVLICTLFTMACFAMTLGPVTWVLISEIFPNRIRGAAVSIAVSALWIACFVLTYTFPLLNQALGAAGTFWVYAAICLAGFVFVLLCVPETMGKTLEQIEAKYLSPIHSNRSLRS
jgi:sugar porter (SP) family MFS transporter